MSVEVAAQKACIDPLKDDAGRVQADIVPVYGAASPL
jgi:hypothetical protein